MTLTSTPIVSMYDVGETSVLRCPRCNSDYLHQEETTIFTRGEDESTLIKTHEAFGKVEVETVPAKESGNPSSRRQGMTVRFRCEGCGGDTPDDFILLILSQHKGNTEIGWRFTPKQVQRVGS